MLIKDHAASHDTSRNDLVIDTLQLSDAARIGARRTWNPNKHHRCWNCILQTCQTKVSTPQVTPLIKPFGRFYAANLRELVVKGYLFNALLQWKYKPFTWLFIEFKRLAWKQHFLEIISLQSAESGTGKLWSYWESATLRQLHQML